MSRNASSARLLRAEWLLHDNQHQIAFSAGPPAGGNQRRDTGGGVTQEALHVRLKGDGATPGKGRTQGPRCHGPPGIVCSARRQGITCRAS